MDTKDVLKRKVQSAGTVGPTNYAHIKDTVSTHSQWFKKPSQANIIKTSNPANLNLVITFSRPGGGRWLLQDSAGRGLPEFSVEKDSKAESG